jgi:hypothetical protein
LSFEGLVFVIAEGLLDRRIVRPSGIVQRLVAPISKYHYFVTQVGA